MALRARRVTWPARPLARAQNPLIARTALPRRAADRSTRRAAAPRLERFGSWQVRPGHPTCRWPRVRSARCARPRERAARKEPTPTACRARRRGRSGQRDGLPAGFAAAAATAVARCRFGPRRLRASPLVFAHCTVLACAASPFVWVALLLQYWVAPRITAPLRCTREKSQLLSLRARFFLVFCAAWRRILKENGPRCARLKCSL